MEHRRPRATAATHRHVMRRPRADTLVLIDVELRHLRIICCWCHNESSQQRSSVSRFHCGGFAGRVVASPARGPANETNYYVRQGPYADATAARRRRRRAINEYAGRRPPRKPPQSARSAGPQRPRQSETPPSRRAERLSRTGTKGFIRARQPGLPMPQRERCQEGLHVLQ